MIKVIVIGAKGKMGSTTVQAINDAAHLQLCAAIDIGDSLIDTCTQHQPDVAVDFTHPSSVFENTKCLIEHNVRPVIGTSGLSVEQIEELSEWASQKKCGTLICPNFAIGAILMMKLSKEIAAYMPHCEIIEMHHNQKADAPSGTATKTAELIQSANPNINHTQLEEKEIVPGARGGNYQNIPIHSVRLPGYVAHQEIIFGGQGQTLRLRHDSIDRTSFMPGVILAVEKVMTLEHLIYGLDNVI